MKYLLSLLCLLYLPLLLAQTAPIKVIATQIDPGQGSKIHTATYKVLKVLEGQLDASTIKVGYYFYTDTLPHPDTVLLHLQPYAGKAAPKNYYIFPNYNAIQGIKTVQLSYVSFEHWEGCETGKAPCPTLTFERDSKADYWYLWMPCGGTYTDVSLTGGTPPKVLQRTGIETNQCPPVFELTQLPSGSYSAHMMACGLGGFVTIELINPTK